MKTKLEVNLPDKTKNEDHKLERANSDVSQKINNLLSENLSRYRAPSPIALFPIDD